ncbi:thioredoxin domain-containing protein [Actinomycetospora sp. TBRC 11914]|uniref:DsbA family protein n=1 Tax=Actinomycetospora sp. TBRC 11914 TaxID=2729387 RepID=UPI00145EC4E3|nr:thioredoxin domain-containing protein [Actinomycetospora sp. TBRC 11914]NMO88358.1 thioredoxin domain-containing protein [Actinomycetospora sp. TBRC 11914]
MTSPPPTDQPVEQDREHRGRRRLLLGAAVTLVVLAVLAVVAVTSGRSASSSGTPAASAGDPVAQARLAVARRQPGDPLALGSPTAPVVVSEWGDFQCPFCRLYTTNTQPALLRRYVDSGAVRIEWHDFAYLGPESVLEAKAARAAGRQGRFWDFHAALYRDQPPENRGQVTPASLSALAGRLGLDVPRFEHDEADPAIARAVTDDQQLGSRLGVGGVPSFVIGDQLLFGAQPLATFQQAIDGALAARR